MKQQADRIHSGRLMATIEKSAEIGMLPNGGLCRLTLTDEDKEMRDLFFQWMNESGLEVRIDDLGNMYGRRGGKNNRLAPVLIGSHLDTQPKGGKFDGILGVLGALEVIRSLNDHGIETERPIEIVNFTNEEGARFEPSMLGSGVIAHVFNKQLMMNTKDQNGFTFGEELARIGYQGSIENRPKDIFCYLELHIEQGAILEDNHKTIGIVTGIQGMNWLEVSVNGKTSHTGTTPMHKRKDAVLHTAKLITKIYELAEKVPDLLIAVGRINASPNVINSIAGATVFSVDIRHPDDFVRERFTTMLKESLATMTFLEEMEISIKEINKEETEVFSEDILKITEEAAKKHGYSSLKMMSGAGHDAKYLNRLAPTGMIFIPSVNGVSHCEEEYSTSDDIDKGVQVLFDTVIRLANKKEW
ncbi:M20 family metallo-hydrolase [Neobacillus mesonae]|uniref:M20 family metallo-hydrolase n=1 Tax=Neobacillus mesonae TaxID=1193713 RepID=UPI002042500D|nr:M20 family metallo-hydrolase [Neobacillus mesonae]MCM3570590.1 M20 family metallo-hydrolase [Neobacillus mesonae]